MDPFFLATFTFVLLLVLLVGGFVVTFPVTRRLGAYLEMELERRRGSTLDPKQQQLQALRGEVRALKAEVQRLEERQTFVDELLPDEAEARRLRGTRDIGVPEDHPA